MAIQAMAEIGIDIARGRSKHIDEVAWQTFDLVVTVCDNAKESCPALPGATKQLHWPFDDPAVIQAGETEKFQAFRRVRDEIATSVRAYISASPTSTPASSGR